MDDLFIDMLHLGHLPRQFPSVLPVDNIGHIPLKTRWVSCLFQTYNFSFILSGGGEYHLEGTCWNMQAPCVLTQAPDRRQEYGPTGKWKEWEELFLTYAPTRIPALKQAGMIRDQPVWNIRDIGPTRERMLELRRLTPHVRKRGVADRVDRLCELLVIESILGETSDSLTPQEQAIEAIRDQVALHFLQPHDFHSLAREHGFSNSAFLRHWNARVGVPPLHYLMRLRLEEACRLLVETHLTVREVADTVGFRDPLYFYRRFRMQTGVTAATYRRTHQSPISFAQPKPNAPVQG